MKKLLFLSAVIAASLTPAQAQKIWRGPSGAGESGAWLASNFEGGTIPYWEVARFQLTNTYSTAHTTVSITAAARATLQLGLGKSVRVEVGNLGSLQGDSVIVGSDYSGSTGTGAASAIITTAAGAPPATVVFNQFVVGYRTSTAYTGGHSLTLTGENLTIASLQNNLASIVGRDGDDNLMTISGGAKVSLHGLIAGRENRNNGFVVTGNNTALTVGANHVDSRIGIGASANSRSNYGRIENGAQLTVTQGKTITIGHLDGFGGNSLEIGTGSTLTTNGATTITGYALNAGNHDGANRLLIGSGGKLTSTSTITTAGHLILEEGAELDATAITVAAGGRMVASGNGLKENAAVTLSSGGTFALGQDSSGAPGTFILNGTLNAQTGSQMEFAFDNNHGFNSLVLEETASLLIASNVTLVLTPTGSSPLAAGERWTLFSGAVGNIEGDFDLSLIDTNLWDVSRLNAAGGWEVAAVPEPSSVALMILTATGALALAHRRRRVR